MNLEGVAKKFEEGYVLSHEECGEALEALLSPRFKDDAKATFLTAQMDRGLKREELLGFAHAALVKAVEPGFHSRIRGKAILDCCGTGGGGVDLINISTAIIFILVPFGIPVVKHGNRGVTKCSGSADVLEALGMKIDLKPKQLQAAVREIGWGFVYAPHYHPSFKAIAPVRRDLGREGKKTIFNFLGPLLNPVLPKVQLVGTFSADLLRLYHDTLMDLECDSACVAYGVSEDGMPLGEASICPGSQSTLGMEIDPELAAKFPIGPLGPLLVESAAESAARLKQVFLYPRDPQNQAIANLLAINAAHALVIHGRARELEHGVTIALESLWTGAAAKCLVESQAYLESLG